jgi:hypothetical protein
MIGFAASAALSKDPSSGFVIMGIVLPLSLVASIIPRCVLEFVRRVRKHREYSARTAA